MEERKMPENYIVINGVTYELVERTGLVTVPGSGLVAGPKLADIAMGDTFMLDKHEFVVLEQSGDTTAAIRKSLLVERAEFGKNNNFDSSNVDRICQKFAKEIAAIVGEENLVEHTVDLTSDDGLKDYGKIRRKASLLTTDLYRRYVEILDKHKINKWWWLATAHSTPRHENTTWVKCVAPGGFGNGRCGINRGVRPFCIFKSNIFVS